MAPYAYHLRAILKVNTKHDNELQFHLFTTARIITDCAHNMILQFALLKLRYYKTRQLRIFQYTRQLLIQFTANITKLILDMRMRANENMVTE